MLMVFVIKNRNFEVVVEILESEMWRSIYKIIFLLIYLDRNVFFDVILVDYVEIIKVFFENGYDLNYICDGYGILLYYVLEFNSFNLCCVVEIFFYFGV